VQIELINENVKMSMNLSIKNTIIQHCAANGLRVAHAVDLYHEIRDDLGWPDDIASSDEIKGALLGMKNQREGLYGVSYKIIDEWIAAL